MNAPLIFVHVTRACHIEYILHQAVNVIDERKIILLGDNHNACFGSFVSWHHLSEYMDGWEAFDVVYKHRSPNRAAFEKMCFLRWFALKNYMARHNIPAAFYSDSDNLWYADISPYEKAFRCADMATGLFPEYEEDFHYAVSPSFTYITLACIKRLCGFFTHLYTRDLDYIYGNRSQGISAG
jgi:hypothetical protein